MKHRSNIMGLFKVLPLCALLIALAPSALQAGSGPNKLQREVPDAFKTIAAFPYAIGISDANNDTIFECLTVLRSQFDPVAKTATYVWSLNQGPGEERKYVDMQYTAGETPDTVNFADETGKIQVKYFRYSDYKECTVTESTYFGEACTLWVTKEVEHRVPEHCLEQFSDICGLAVPLRPADLCEDDYTDVADPAK
ncbi:uncharacterized protein LOC144147100 [Haemaphysalis longicornis]